MDDDHGWCSLVVLANDPVANMRTALRDAFLHWHAAVIFQCMAWANIHGDYEGDIQTELNFSARSVASQGSVQLGYQQSCAG